MHLSHLTSSLGVISCEYVAKTYTAKTRYNGLPADEDRIILCSFALTQYRRVTDRRTVGHADEQIDRIAVAKTS